PRPTSEERAGFVSWSDSFLEREGPAAGARAPRITAHYGRWVEPVATDAARRGTTAPGPGAKCPPGTCPPPRGAGAWRCACRRWGHALDSVPQPGCCPARHGERHGTTPR